MSSRITGSTTTTTTIFSGGDVYLPAGIQPGAVAVRDGRIVSAGDEESVRRAIAGEVLEEVDLKGGLLSPSFGDSHLHPIFGGLELMSCALHESQSQKDCLQRVAEYAAANPDLPWITGGGWSLELFPGGVPLSSWLDAVVPDRPVMLKSRDQHSAWVNSKALELAGIDRDTPDPADGRIERDSEGNPTGTLHEGAFLLVDRITPKPSEDSLLAALVRGQQHAAKFGITAWQDAMLRRYSPEVDVVDVYLRAVRAGQLKARVSGALWWDRNQGLEQLDSLLERRSRVACAASPDHFDAGSLKIMIDGVVESFTASMSTPYLDSCGCSTDNYGLSFLNRQELTDAIVSADAEGFQIHLHSLGDRAVTDGLDAIERARQVNGARSSRHTLAHLQVIVPKDIERFAALDAVPNLQPLWACNEPQMTELTLPFLAEEVQSRQYPFADIVRTGVLCAAGSDWPVSSINPLEGMQVAVTRRPIEDPSADPLLPSQAMDLRTVWDAYTSGVAYLNHREGVHGRLEPGFAADLVVLDRDPFAGPASSISQTRVVSTWFAGERIYGD